jgi:hypothetical protein
LARLLRTLVVLCVVVALAGGCANQAAISPSAGTVTPDAATPPVASATAGGSAGAAGSAAASPTVADARIADLAYLVVRLKATHRNPFLDEGEAAFMARVAAIEADAATLTDTGFLVAVMRLMGHRDRDGHSGAWAMAQADATLSAWPIWLWDFPDGLRVVAARAPYAGLVGARVTNVGHVAIAEARAAVDQLVPRDNASTLRGNLPIYLTLPGVLAELGLLGPGDPGLTLAMPDGSTREVTPAAVPMNVFRDWVFGAWGGLFPESLPPDVKGPRYLRHRELAFWSEALAKPAATYVGYNEVTRQASDGSTLTDLADSLEATATAHPGRPVIVDLRNNGGGDNNTFGPLRDELESIAAAHPGSVSLIAGRSTFSAAGNFVTDLKVGRQKAGIRLVGEAPGGGLNIYGDVVVLTLPASGIIVLVSGRYHERAPGDDRLALEPDIPVEVTWADYAAGRDPVLEAARKP